MNTRSIRLILQEELFLFSSLMQITCFFLPWYGEPGRDGSPYQWLFGSNGTIEVILAIVLLILVVLTPFATTSSRMRPWLSIVTTLFVNLVIFYTGLRFGRVAYGASLERFFAAAALVLSVRPAFAVAGDLVMRKLNSRKAEVFTHWGTVLPLHFSAQEFYAKLETKIRERRWPGIELLRVAYT